MSLVMDSACPASLFALHEQNVTTAANRTGSCTTAQRPDISSPFVSRVLGVSHFFLSLTSSPCPRSLSSSSPSSSVLLPVCSDALMPSSS